VFVGLPGAAGYADPWTEGLQLRLTQLCRGRRRVAYVYELPDTSTFRYRAYNMIEALGPAAETIGAAWFCMSDLDHAAEQIVDNADVIVLCRTRYSDHVARFVAAVKKRGRRLLFDVDDLVFDTRYTHLIMNTLDQRSGSEDFDTWFALIGRIGGALRLCDGAITTNAYLAARITDFAGIPTSVVPNFLNTRQLTISDAIIEAKRAQGYATSGNPYLGYFSGTPTHNLDFGLIAPTLAELMTEYQRLHLRLVGFLEPPPVLLPFSDRIERIPLQDFVNLQRRVGEVELNLVPLQDNVFTRCKSELKVFEAAVVGTLSIASPSPTLASTIIDDQTGWLAAPHRWGDVLRRALDCPPTVYAEKAEAAAAAARSRYAPAAQVTTILRALFPDLTSTTDATALTPVDGLAAG